jgi:hypothetical protein
MVRPSRRRVGIYVSCAVILSLSLVFETWVVTRHSVGGQAGTRGSAEAEPDRDARPLPRATRLLGTSHIDSRLSGVATRLGRGRAEVRCWSIAEWDTLLRELGEGDEVTAYTTIDRRLVQLPSYRCSWLHVAGVREFPRLGRAGALAAFAHELEHLRGIDEEARAECYSHQNLAAVAEALGASRREAQRLGRVAWRELYPPDDPEYVSVECRNGGRLDLHPHRRRWP